MTSAFLFPEMGTQTAIDRTVYEQSEPFRTQFDRLDDAVDIDLERLCFDLPEDELAMPRHAEPAIVAVSYCFAKTAEANGHTPDYVIGPSLGQFTALGFVGAIAPEEMLSLVRRRGELIEEHGADGKMIGVITDDIERVTERIDSYGDLSIAVRMSQQLCGVSGDDDALDDLLGTLRETAPVLETISMDTINHAFHSPLLEPALPEFAAAVAECAFSDDFRYPIVSDVDGSIKTDADGLEDELTDSVVASVRFDRILETMQAEGLETCFELLPAGRFSKAIPDIDPNVDLVEPTELY